MTNQEDPKLLYRGRISFTDSQEFINQKIARKKLLETLFPVDEFKARNIYGLRISTTECGAPWRQDDKTGIEALLAIPTPGNEKLGVFHFVEVSPIIHPGQIESGSLICSVYRYTGDESLRRQIQDNIRTEFGKLGFRSE